MSLKYFYQNGLQPQINLIQSVVKALINPRAGNSLEQIFSLLNVIGTSSKKNVIMRSNKAVKLTAIPISQGALPIESIKGIGKKLGTKLRSYGITTTVDLKSIEPKDYDIPGISQKRLIKWKNNN